MSTTMGSGQSWVLKLAAHNLMKTFDLSSEDIGAAVLVIFLILTTNLPMIVSTWRNRKTILDSLLILECFNNVSHCYIILTNIKHIVSEPVFCYAQVILVEIVGNMDRVIPLMVAIYRFCMVVFALRFTVVQNVKVLGICIWVMMTGMVVYYTGTGFVLVQHNVLYFECIGKEDRFYLQNKEENLGADLNVILYNIPLTSPALITNTLLVVLTFISVPLFYIVIMVIRFRKDRYTGYTWCTWCTRYTWCTWYNY
ncbi:uncharacterized protein LOC111701875 [Eurytemora carolleeae]|uniref:uncharacterized protein LOC111701875 n=1 Tax=Eurytemora carolleeae TaxID=1294199 RepID=UPI000C7720E7|nr:uncharacterized protein LOC111701875 [Eurytemora carolleeae]|eukprot:XP_023329124.1 uncharacterized protein LOC111701875 [Eurytemora affinis]